MVFRKNSKSAVAALFLAVFAMPAMAQNYDDLSRSDFISLSAGNAPRANIAIQTPTPWPPYLNDRRIPGYARHGVTVIEAFDKRYIPPPPPTTVINIGTGSTPGQ